LGISIIVVMKKPRPKAISRVPWRCGRCSGRNLESRSVAVRVRAKVHPSLWRCKMNTPFTLPNDSTPRTDASDFDVWRAHFGQAAGSGAGTVANIAVPEPPILVMRLMGAVVMLSLRLTIVS
jgi:hypothetical protein